MSETPRILVAEDDKFHRELTARLLRGRGYEVTTVQDGEEAVRSALEQLPDLVVLDVNMPRLDGYEVARLLRRAPLTAAVPIVFLTSRAQDLDYLIGFEAGANHYLTKPVDSPLLLKTVDCALRGEEVTDDGAARWEPGFAPE